MQNGRQVKTGRYTGWDLWTMKYTLIGLLAYAEQFEDDNVLKACERLGDCVMKHVEDFTPEAFVTSSYHNGMANTSILEPMAYLYEASANEKFLEFCPKIFHPDVLPDVHKGSFGMGKIYERQSNYLGFLEYGRLARPEFVEGLAKAVMNKLEAKAHYPTGAVSVGDKAAGTSLPLTVKGPNTPFFKLGKAWEMASERQRKGSPKDGSEGCDTVTWLQLNLALFQLTGKIPYLEEAECVAYNQLSAHQQPSTGSFDYFLSPHGVRTFANRYSHYCCMYSLPRGLAMLPEMAAGSIDGKAALVLYLPGSYRTEVKTDTGIKEVELVVETNFPVSGKGVIRVKSVQKEYFSVMLRVPSYTSSFMAKTGGKKYQGKAGEFLCISRRWARNDRIDFDMEMDISLVRLGAADNEAQAHHGIRRGPQFLAVDHNTDTGQMLDKDWIGTQKYQVPLRRDGIDVVLYMVPYGDAGQTGGDVEVFFTGIEKAPGLVDSIGG